MDIEFDCGKMGFYDFDKIQYHSRIRGTGIRIQGDRGELYGDSLDLYGQKRPALQEKILQWENPYKSLGFSEDETAVARSAGRHEAVYGDRRSSFIRWQRPYRMLISLFAWKKPCFTHMKPFSPRPRCGVIDHD